MIDHLISQDIDNSIHQQKKSANKKKKKIQKRGKINFCPFCFCLPDNMNIRKKMVIFNNANTVFPVGCIFLFGTRKAFKNIKMEISQVIKQRLQVAYNSFISLEVSWDLGGKLCQYL